MIKTAESERFALPADERPHIVAGTMCGIKASFELSAEYIWDYNVDIQ